MTSDNAVPLTQKSFHIRKSLKDLAHRPRLNKRKQHLPNLCLPLPSLPSHLNAKDNYVYDILYECQRGSWLVGYSSKTLLQFDPNPWCDAYMKYTPMNPTTYQLPDPTWEWVSKEWMVDMTEDVDEAGWQYSVKFHGAVWHGNYKHFRSFVRRRRWIRLRHRGQQQQKDQSGESKNQGDIVKTRQLVKIDGDDDDDDNTKQQQQQLAESSKSMNETDLLNSLKNCRLDRERRSVFDSLLSSSSTTQIDSLLADEEKVMNKINCW
ncbi:hypothetical protein BCR42DRAFT_415774 [Absidia repens]|uniref:Peroxin/Ferlin domain-containing protein n=1 Tax=Absidia repens TaxID=90262 RepID=A0A1X2IFQ7_9FUNG|nr:hypothetical protein BCR42DRAFT_415774 [Absidia repens]